MFGSFKKIEITMARKGVNQVQLAEAMGQTRAGVSLLLTDVENNKDITPARLGLLAQALGVDVTEIMPDDPNGKEKAA